MDRFDHYTLASIAKEKEASEANLSQIDALEALLALHNDN